jgi:hypothetical protein
LKLPTLITHPVHQVFDSVGKTRFWAFNALSLKAFGRGWNNAILIYGHDAPLEFSRRYSRGGMQVKAPEMNVNATSVFVLWACLSLLSAKSVQISVQINERPQEFNGCGSEPP